ncbi:MAG: DUF4147 domain-containing protein [Leptospiraceae bacterium]|nr:DUF4147 domain-containing protein [Leptospiraceae bacterium]
MDYKQIAKEVFLAGVEKVKPDKLIFDSINFIDSTLTIKEDKYNLNYYNNIYLLGAGKASVKMGQAMEFILGDYLADGLIITKYDHSLPTKRIKVFEASHPYPDENSLIAANKIKDFCKKCKEGDLVFFLLSGGASSLLGDFDYSITLEEFQTLTSLLLSCGATIEEINTIRKQTGYLKGGKLCSLVYPAQLITLILSDVVGDRLESIASGPTVPDSSTPEDAISILNKYSIWEKTPKIIQSFLENKTNREIANIHFSKTSNYIIGNNKIALEACSKKAKEFGLSSIIITSSLQGDINDVMEEIKNEIKHFSENNNFTCLLFGGEQTLKINGNGKGGRNQHLALLALKYLSNFNNLTFLSAGTDGTDGPTDAAGAVIDSKEKFEKDIDTYLIYYNSYEFFIGTNSHILTGPTGTNVMDIIIVILH